MKLTQSQRTNEAQDLATATLATVPIADMASEMRRWCIWHNACPDRINLVPISVPTGTNDFITYGGDALLLAEYTTIKTYHAVRRGDLKIAIAIVHLPQLENLMAQLLKVGITLAVIPDEDPIAD